MILEVAMLDVREGTRDGFEAAFAEASGVISSMPGYVSHELQRCIETPDRYVLLVRWETLEDHTEGFRESDERNGSGFSTTSTIPSRSSSTSK